MPQFGGLVYQPVFSSQDPFCGIDIDDSLAAGGNLKPWDQGIVERFGGTYMEASPSAGLKISPE
jgi:hypothetical protein